nr:nuclear RNA polymerase D1B [Tanacetum cinerariifolium]
MLSLERSYSRKFLIKKKNTQDSSKNTKFAKQPNVEILSKIGETNALSKPVTSNSVSQPQVSKGVNNAKVIAPGMFRISPDKVSREAKKVPNTVSASSRTKPITVSQPSVITKKGMNSNSNGLSSTGLDNTKTRCNAPLRKEDVISEMLLQKAFEIGADQCGWKKKDECVPKRDNPARPVGGPNDSPRPGGPFTTPKQRSEIFKADEQEILNEIKSIIQSMRRIMHQSRPSC